jgi:hypothetical protein
MGIGATAARPSCEVVSGGTAPTLALDRTRCSAESAAVWSLGVSADPSRRATTSIAGGSLRPGKDVNSAATFADSADGGSWTGALSAPVFDPASAMNAPAPAAISSAIAHEYWWVTAAAIRSHTATLPD